MKNWILNNRYFTLAALFCLVFLLGASLDSGINGDDRFHIPQGVYSLKWYTSMGEDKSFMISKDEGGGMVGISTYDYGVLIELVNNVVNNILGNDPSEERYHTVRHMIIAMFGFIGILFAGMIGRFLFNWKAGVLFMLLLTFTPRYLGHATFNPKDLPFAVGYIATLYFLIKFLSELKNPRWITAIGFAGSLAIALSARIGGLLLIVYAFMFTAIALFLDRSDSEVKSKKKVASKGFASKYFIPMRNLVLISLAGYFGGLLFWPYGLMDPINNPLSVLRGWTNFRTTISILFEGNIISSGSVPWNYIPKYLIITTPIIILLGSILSIWLFFDFIRQKKTIKALAIFILHFTVAFPIIYVIYKESVLYDGFRHMLFTLPPLVVLGGSGLYFLTEKFKNRYIQIAVIAVVIAGMAKPVFHIVSNPTVAYVYFNQLIGNNEGAFGYYETDYWGLSVKDAVSYLEEEGLLEGGTEEDPIVISTNFGYSLSVYVKDHQPNAKKQYVQFRARYDKDWDYGIFVNRFIDASHLRSGKWPSSRAIHTIDAGGIPVCAIYQNLDKWPSKGQEALNNKNWQASITNFEKEVELHPDNEIAWNSLGTAYQNTNRAQDAINAYQNALKINPEDQSASSQLGMLYVNTNQINKAKQVFFDQIKLNPINANAYYYLAVVEYNANNLNGAFTYVQQAIEINPNFRSAYQLLANIYEALGNKAQADNIRRQLR
ncbi:MAG: tetratricopeptide repeat protein [Chitinophagales bacterium]|nr:tetratricopeptide repeat protein [Chitinophagales bacterium]